MAKKIVILLMVLPVIVNWHWFEAHAKKNRKGVEAYNQKKYSDALKSFLGAKGLKPDLDVLKSNTSVTLYQMKKYKEALKEFEGIDPEKTSIKKTDLFYNLGNTYFRMNKFQEALEKYKKSLIADGSNFEAKKNYEITLKKIEEQKKKQNKKDKKDKDNKDKKKNKKQDQKEDPKKGNREQDKKKEQNKPQKKDDTNRKYKNLMNYLNQNEKKQQKKKKRNTGAILNREKDW